MDKNLGDRLSHLLELRNIVRNSQNFSKNQLLAVQGLHRLDCQENDICRLHDDVFDHIVRKHNNDMGASDHLLSRLNSHIRTTCDHEWINDEIECPMSEVISTIRYCRVCELSAD